MTNDRPFHDKERRALRRRQRETLRLIDDWIVNTALTNFITPTPTLPDDDTRDLVETSLREEAEALITEINGLDPTILTRIASSVKAQHTARFINQAQDEGPSQGAAVLQEALNAADQSVGERVREIEEPPDLFAAVIDLVAALVWADHVADDDYVDPRVAQRLTS